MSRFEALRKLQSGELVDSLGLRARPRFITTMVTCAAGEVLDICAGGLRILSKKPTGEPSDQIHTLTVQSPWGHCDLEVRIVWTKKLKRRRFETGVEFVDPKQASGLLRICWDPLTGPANAA